MARSKQEPLDPKKLEGLKYFRLIDDLLVRLHNHGTARDRAGNRELFFDQDATLFLLYFFNPTVTSLRGVQKFTTLEKVQKLCGVKPTSMASLSEAAKVFDPEVLKPIIAQLAAQAPGTFPPARKAALAGLVAVDGSLLKAMSRMTWALWQDSTHRAAKRHVAFAVFEPVPVDVSVTHGNSSEREELKQFVRPGGFYVADRGDANNAVFREFDAHNVRFLIRVQENTTFDVCEERPLSPLDREAGVVRDVLVRRLGTEKHNPLLKQPLRIVEVQGSEPDQRWILATNARELSADLVAAAYHDRWQIELFFRLAEVRPGVQTSSERKPAGCDAAGLRGGHRGSADRPVGGSQTDGADLRDAVSLPERLGYSRRTGTPPRENATRPRPA